MSDTTYATKKLGQAAVKNRRLAYIITLRGCEQNVAEEPSYLMNLHLNTIF